MKKRDDYSQYSKAMLGRIKTKSGIAFLIAMVLILVLIVRVIIINVADGAYQHRWEIIKYMLWDTLLT